jgi:hypothetical protein
VERPFSFDPVPYLHPTELLTKGSSIPSPPACVAKYDPLAQSPLFAIDFTKQLDRLGIQSNLSGSPCPAQDCGRTLKIHVFPRQSAKFTDSAHRQSDESQGAFVLFVRAETDII